jgi:hypothetical protein
MSRERDGHWPTQTTLETSFSASIGILNKPVADGAVFPPALAPQEAPVTALLKLFPAGGPSSVLHPNFISISQGDAAHREPRRDFDIRRQGNSLRQRRGDTPISTRRANR